MGRTLLLSPPNLQLDLAFSPGLPAALRGHRAASAGASFSAWPGFCFYSPSHAMTPFSSAPMGVWHSFEGLIDHVHDPNVSPRHPFYLGFSDAK
jgi:hypothetical protein